MVSRMLQDPALEALYNVRAAVPNHPAVFAEWRSRSADLRRRAVARLDLRYDSAENTTLDFFPATGGRGPAPLHVFLHGGYWQAMDKSDFSFVAEPFLARGIHVAIVNYPLCPMVSLDELVECVRRAFLWLRRESAPLGVDPKRIQISGHSAGGHLAAMMVATDWQKGGRQDAEAPFSSVVSVSGLFDLEPLRATSINEKVGLDAAAAKRNSPICLAPCVRVPMVLAVGAAESTGFHDQTARLAERWSPLGISVQILSLAERNHFGAVDMLAEPESPLFAAAYEMLAGRNGR